MLRTRATARWHDDDYAHMLRAGAKSGEESAMLQALLRAYARDIEAHDVIRRHIERLLRQDGYAILLQYAMIRAPR